MYKSVEFLRDQIIFLGFTFLNLICPPKFFGEEGFFLSDYLHLSNSNAPMPRLAVHPESAPFRRLDELNSIGGPNREKNFYKALSRPVKRPDGRSL